MQKAKAHGIRRHHACLCRARQTGERSSAAPTGQRLIKAHEIQLVNYLVATGIPVGLLINFGETRADVKRRVRQLTN